MVGETGETEARAGSEAAEAAEEKAGAGAAER